MKRSYTLCTISGVSRVGLRYIRLGINGKTCWLILEESGRCSHHRRARRSHNGW